jgi:hypothetical protein
MVGVSLSVVGGGFEDEFSRFSFSGRFTPERKKASSSALAGHFTEFTFDANEVGVTFVVEHASLGGCIAVDTTHVIGWRVLNLFDVGRAKLLDNHSNTSPGNS